MTSQRARAVALALFAFLFLVNVPNVFATHFRYGTIYWEKVLSAETATTIRVRMTYEVAMRWSFPYSPSANPPIGTVVNLGTITLAGTGFSSSSPFNATVTSIQAAQDTMFAVYTFDVDLPKSALPVTFDWTSNARISTLLEGNNDQLWKLATKVPNDPAVTRSPRSVSLPMISVVNNAVNSVGLPSVAFDNMVNTWRFSTSAESALIKPVPTGMSLNPSGTINFTPTTLGLYAVQFMIEARDANGVLHASVPLDMLFQSVTGTGSVSAVSVPQTTYTASVGVPFSYTVTSTLTNPAGYTSVINNTPLPAGASVTAPTCAAGSATCTSTFNWTPTLASSGAIVCYQASHSNVSNGLTVQSSQLCVTVNIGALPTTMQAFAATGVASGPVTLSAKLSRTADNAPVIGRDVIFSWLDSGEVLGTDQTDTAGIATVNPTIVLPTPGRLYQATFAGVANQFLQSSASAMAVVTVGASGVINAPPVVSPAAPKVGDPVSVSAILNRIYPDGGLFGVGQTLVFSLTDPQGGQTVLSGGPTTAAGLASVTFPGQPAAGTYTARASFAGSVSLAGPSTSPATSFTVFQRTRLVAIAASGTIGLPTAVSATLTALPGGTPLAGRTISFTAPGGVTATGVTDANGVANASLVFPASGAITYTASYLPASPYLNQNGLAATESATATAIIAAIQPTQLAFGPASGIAGGLVTLSATLTSSGTPLAGESITFTQSGVPVGTGVTSSSGIASIVYTPGTAGSFPSQASFAGAPTYAAASASSTIEVASAATTLSAIPVPMMFVGDSLVVSTTLSRTSAPAGPVGGASVTFTLTSAVSGVSSALTASTAVDGVATISFPAFAARGPYQLIASFAGTGALAATSQSASVTVYQKVQVLATPAQGYAGSTIPVAATLVALPGQTPVMGQTLSFDFLGAAPSASSTTDATGIGQTTSIFASAGSYPVLVSFSNVADFFANEAGVLAPSIAQTTVTAAFATTALTINPSASSVVGAAIGLNATLTRTSAPAGLVSGVPVEFTVTLPDGSTVTVAATTTANGEAAAAFTATMAGVHSYSATFAGNAGMSASASDTSTVAVYQRTALTMADANGSATKPITISASLTNLPSGTPVGNQTVTFAFSGPGSPAPVTATTNGAGTASVTVTFPTVATYDVTATFSNAAAFYTDGAGAIPPAATIATATVAVTNNAPTFTSPANLSLPATSAAGRAVTFTATGSDIEDGTLTADCAVRSGDTFPLGTTTLDCTVTDSAGAQASGSFDISITNSAPTLSTPANITAEATSAAGASVSFSVSGNDVEDGVVPAACTPAAGVFAIGTTAVNCTVTDVAGATASAAFSVIVSDTTPPSLMLPTVAPAYATTAAGRVATYTVTATDSVDAAVAVSCAPPSGSTFAIGTTTVTCTATDASGNSQSGSFPVQVLNNAPTFTPPANITVDATNAAGAVVTFTAGGNDLEDGARIAVCTPASGTTFAIGTTTVNCTVTDTRGATATGSFTVTVKDVTTPGDMHGEGHVRADDTKYEFEFRARENARGDERATISVHIEDEGRKKGKKREDRFVSRTVNFIAFSDDPTIRPGRPRRQQIDTVTFTGIGEWNGLRNYRYEAFAQDAGEPGRHRESIRVKIYSPTGALVASFEGDLDGGNIQSARIRH